MKIITHSTRICAATMLFALLGLAAWGRVAAQSDGNLAVAITRVNDRTFPQVMAHVAVLGADGRPVDTLTAADFELSEDGRLIPSASVTVNKDDTQDIDLILALDLDTTDETLAQVRTGVKSFLPTLGRQDRIALVAFQDQARLVQGADGSADEMRAALDGLATGGSYTALNAAIIEAATLADAHQSGRTALVVVTDGGASPEGAAPAEALDRAVQAGLIIYVISLEPGGEPDALSAVAGPTRGQVYQLSAPAEVKPILQEVAWLLRRGYRVSFRSSLPPDDGPHTLSIGISGAEGTGQAEDEFIAASGQVHVTLSIPQEIEAGGMVTVTARIEASADVAEVEFLLDGQSLGRVEEPPYRILVESGDYPAGEHTIAARVQDSLGREGEDSLSVQFPARRELRWWQYALAVVALISFALIALVAIVAFLFLFKWQKKRYAQTCRVEIKNLGNVQTGYRLLAEEQSGALGFQFALEGVNLHRRQVTRTIGGTDEGAVVETFEPGAAQRPVSSAPARRGDGGRQLAGARQKAGRVLGLGQAAADVLGAVGALLPASLGRPLKSMSTRLRQQQTRVSRVERVPRQAMSRAQKIPRRMSKARPQGRSPRVEAAPAPGEEAGRVQRRPAAPRSITQTVVDVWARTFPIEPGGTLALDLLVAPLKRPAQTQSYTFTVTSMPVGQEEGPAEAQEGTIQIERVPLLRHLWPFLALAAAAGGAFLLLGALLWVAVII